MTHNRYKIGNDLLDGVSKARSGESEIKYSCKLPRDMRADAETVSNDRNAAITCSFREIVHNTIVFRDGEIPPEALGVNVKISEEYECLVVFQNGSPMTYQEIGGKFFTPHQSSGRKEQAFGEGANTGLFSATDLENVMIGAASVSDSSKENWVGMCETVRNATNELLVFDASESLDRFIKEVILRLPEEYRKKFNNVFIALSRSCPRNKFDLKTLVPYVSESLGELIKVVSFKIIGKTINLAERHNSEDPVQIPCIEELYSHLIDEKDPIFEFTDTITIAVDSGKFQNKLKCKAKFQIIPVNGVWDESSKTYVSSKTLKPYEFGGIYKQNVFLKVPGIHKDLSITKRFELHNIGSSKGVSLALSKMKLPAPFPIPMEWDLKSPVQKRKFEDYKVNPKTTKFRPFVILKVEILEIYHFEKYCDEYSNNNEDLKHNLYEVTTFIGGSLTSMFTLADENKINLFVCKLANEVSHKAPYNGSFLKFKKFLLDIIPDVLDNDFYCPNIFKKEDGGIAGILVNPFLVEEPDDSSYLNKDERKGAFHLRSGTTAFVVYELKSSGKLIPAKEAIEMLNAAGNSGFSFEENTWGDKFVVKVTICKIQTVKGSILEDLSDYNPQTCIPCVMAKICVGDKLKKSPIHRVKELVKKRKEKPTPPKPGPDDIDPDENPENVSKNTEFYFSNLSDLDQIAFVEETNVRFNDKNEFIKVLKSDGNPKHKGHYIKFAQELLDIGDAFAFSMKDVTVKPIYSKEEATLYGPEADDLTYKNDKTLLFNRLLKFMFTSKTTLRDCYETLKEFMEETNLVFSLEEPKIVMHSDKENTQRIHNEEYC